MRSFPGNPYDGHTLGPALEQVEILTDQSPDLAVVDRGYRGHATDKTRVLISGTRRGLTPKLIADLRGRSAIEPEIRHMKSDGRLARCPLKGTIGDALFAVRCGAVRCGAVRCGAVRPKHPKDPGPPQDSFGSLHCGYLGDLQTPPGRPGSAVGSLTALFRCDYRNCAACAASLISRLWPLACGQPARACAPRGSILAKMKVGCPSSWRKYSGEFEGQGPSSVGAGCGYDLVRTTTCAGRRTIA